MAGIDREISLLALAVGRRCRLPDDQLAAAPFDMDLRQVAEKHRPLHAHGPEFSDRSGRSALSRKWTVRKDSVGCAAVIGHG